MEATTTRDPFDHGLVGWAGEVPPIGDYVLLSAFEEEARDAFAAAMARLHGVLLEMEGRQ